MNTPDSVPANSSNLKHAGGDSANGRRERIEAYLKKRIIQSGEEKGQFLHKELIDDTFDLHESGVFDSFDLYQFLLSLEDDLEIKLQFTTMNPRSFTVFGYLVDVLIESGADH